MNRPRLPLILLGLGIIGLTAWSLASIRSRQTLGKPGVRIVNVPLRDDTGRVFTQTSVYLPELAGTMTSTSSPITRLELAKLPADTTYGRRMYQDVDGFQAQVGVVLMGTDRTSIHKPEFCLAGQGWTIEKEEIASVHLDRPQPSELSLQKYTAHITAKDPKTGGMVEYKGLYLFWFVADGMVTESHSKRVWWLARDLVLHQVLDRWAYIAYFSPCFPGQEEKTFERMKLLIANSVPEIQTTFQKEPPALQAAASAR